MSPCTRYGTARWVRHRNVLVSRLRQAWSAIVHALIPNTRLLQANLEEFRRILDADEVVLFERATFLVVSHATYKEHRDVHRFEKISNIIKQFKLSCRCVVSMHHGWLVVTLCVRSTARPRRSFIR